MSSDSIFCLYTDGGALSTHARNFLYATACRMIFKGEKSFHLTDENAEINLRTKFQYSCIGSLAGTHFTGTIEEGDLTIRTAFIIRNTDFERNIHNTRDWVPMTKNHPTLKSSMN